MVDYLSGDEARNALSEMLARARAAVAFTGAGISTECGIPDFRSPGGLWTQNKPIPFAEFLASEEARVEAWRRKFVMDDHYAGAEPGRGHRALAHLVAKGPMLCVITQNIDGLHHASGLAHDEVIELHGNGTYARCMTCNVRHELADVRKTFKETKTAPRCICGGIIKSATISFGQSMPEAEMRRAREATLGCDLFIVIGSSLVVHPAASFPEIAHRNGAELVILNREATPLDSLADLVIRDDIGTVLEPFANRAVS